MSDAPTPVMHATLIARRFCDGWRGALLRGPSGCGKSTLALRALEAGFRLVADDRVLVWTSGARLFGRAPSALEGLLEVRHVAVAARRRLPHAPIAAIVDLRPPPVDRMPEAAVECVCGVALRLYRLPVGGALPQAVNEILATQGPR